MKKPTQTQDCIWVDPFLAFYYFYKNYLKQSTGRGPANIGPAANI
jgi:hypothetical protein